MLHVLSSGRLAKENELPTMTSAFGFVGQDSQNFMMAFWLLLKALMEPVANPEICIIVEFPLWHIVEDDRNH